MTHLYEFERESQFKVYEKIPTQVCETSVQASIKVAQIIRDKIKEKNAKNENCVLGLATGSTPLRVYQELIKMHREEGLSFKNVVTFNLDEYYPMPKESLQSYHRFMKENLFNEIDILPENTHIPDGTIPMDSIDDFCREYENKIKHYGGLDIQILGIGKTGHVGFNEPGSSQYSKTRLIYLDKLTQTDAASDFFGLENVPRKAITMGIETILQAKQVIIMAFSETKADVVQKAVEGPVTEDLPASFLQNHPNALFILDRASSDKLTRLQCPWIIKGISKNLKVTYDKFLKIKAVLWLSQKLNKSISKLVEDDYEKNGLYQMIEDCGHNVQQLNSDVMEHLRTKISDYPAGKGDKKKKILIFSPHPDDDVICMAGTMRKLVDQGHEVHVAYQTSGNIGVFDHDALRFANFMAEAAKIFKFSNVEEIMNIEQKIKDAITRKNSWEPDIKEVQSVKGLIRQTEAFAAALSCGVSEQNVYFLDLPFYETGKVKKKPVGPEDIKIVRSLIDKIQPDQLYAAGDLTDPHGTHRSCLVAILKAWNEIKKDNRSQWHEKCQILLYRGAWQEWDIERVSLAIPLNPDELYNKRMAIFKHQSQKDKALFPGFDSREFWQRAEERNKRTAQLYNQYGLNEYEAMEVFVDYKEMIDIFNYEIA